MDELLASAFYGESPFEILTARMRKIPMTQAEAEAVRLLHREFSQFDILIVSTSRCAASEVLSALPMTPQREDVLRGLAEEVGHEVSNHPEASDGRLFTIRMRYVNGANSLPVLSSKRITRLIALPVSGTLSLRANFMPDDIVTLCKDWDKSGNKDFLVLTICPNDLDQAQLVDPVKEARLPDERQTMRLRAMQGKMLAETMCASVRNHAAGAALFGTLSHLRRIGIQLAVYQSVLNSGVQPDIKQTRMAQLHQIMMLESRSLALALGENLMNACLPSALREALRAELKELNAINMAALRTEFRPKVAITARSAGNIRTGATAPAPMGQIIPLAKSVLRKERSTASTALQESLRSPRPADIQPDIKF